jgi:hypothetical protein
MQADAKPLTVEESYDLLLSWAKTLVNHVTRAKAERHTTLGDIPDDVGEIVGAVEHLDAAIKREKGA